ncbi:hypothetical protein ES708_31912 [subsurface metagenome]
MPQTLHNLYSAEIKEAQALIHELIFLPLVAEITDAVIERKKLPQAASSLEILSEPDIYVRVRVRRASKALSERFALDRSFQGLRDLCPWVAISWLIATISCVVLFFVYHHGSIIIRDFLNTILLGMIILSVLAGGVFLFIYFRALNKLIRIIGDSKL